MKRILLGRTGIEVSELAFGVLPIGPTQKNISVEQGAEIVAYALKNGINFLDTAQLYQTYEYIRLAMKLSGIRPVIVSKAPYATYEEMDVAVKEALGALGVDYIDLFLLHAPRVGDDVFEQRKGALDCLLDYKAKGVIKAVGISTHAVPVVRLAAENEDMDIVFPIINMTGMGILRGTLCEMEEAINLCHANGKGVYLMKALAGGNLIDDYMNAMNYVKGFSDGRFATAMGMVTEQEVDINLKYFNGEDISGLLLKESAPIKRFLVLDGICTLCGECVKACHSEAAVISEGASCAFIDNDKCLKCGYCVAVCKSFCIRMV